MNLLKRPDVLYPTVVRGFIKGRIRAESIDGSEMWFPAGFRDIEEIKETSGLNIFFDKTSETTYLREFKPFEFNHKIWCIPHLQKYSPHFRLLYDPLIFHYGYFWKTQEMTVDGKWIPGTEKGIYGRTPGWRWNIPDENSQGTPWIFSKGYLGGHLD